MSCPPTEDVTPDVTQLRQYAERFVLCPDFWRSYTATHEWECQKLETANTDQIPTESGVYTLVLNPGIAGHPASAYIMYVGKAEDLRRRFNDYLTVERTNRRRTKMYRFLNYYHDEFIHFYFTRIRVDMIDSVENGLRNAYRPPVNSDYEAGISATMGAF